jgi:cytochrome c551/c552
LAFVEQARRTVDWKTVALELAAKYMGIEKAAEWKLEIEASASVQPVTQVRVKANPTYAAGLSKPVASVRIPLL